MKRSPEIVNILRTGIEEMISRRGNLEVKFTRIFNFNENRVSLRMEVADENSNFIPMGRIDVVELAFEDGRSSCDCTLTEFQTGKSDRIMLRLRDSTEREKECQKVFNFFTRILGEPSNESAVIQKHEDSSASSSTVSSDEDKGFQMEPTRGAQPNE